MNFLQASPRPTDTRHNSLFTRDAQQILPSFAPRLGSLVAEREAMGDSGMSLFALSLEQLTQLKQSIEEVRLTATMNAAPA